MPDPNDPAVEAAKLALERERERYTTLLNRSEVNDSRAGTLLSALVIVGGIVGALLSFALDKDSAPTVGKLVGDRAVVILFFTTVAMYGISATVLGASLLISVQTWEGSKGAPSNDYMALLEEARKDYHKLANSVHGISMCKWILLMIGLACFSLAFIAAAVLVSRALFLIGQDLIIAPS